MAGNAVYNTAITHLALGEWTWKAADTDIRVALHKNVLPAKGAGHWDSIEDDEVAEAEVGYDRGTKLIYTGGGDTTLTSAHLLDDVTHFESDPTIWTGATFTAYYASTFHGAAKPAAPAGQLLSYHNLGTQAVVAGTLTLTWANTSGGVFTMTASAET